MSNGSPKKGLRDELGDGYLSLLDSVRHSFEQAAWGQETSPDLTAGDFYRWVGTAQDTPKAMDAAERTGGLEGEVMPAEQSAPADRNWKALEAWIDGEASTVSKHQIEAERGRDGPALEGPELGD